MDASAAIDDNDSDQNSNDSSSSSDNDGSDSDSNDEDSEDTEESSKSPSKAPESDIKEGCTVFVRGLALNTDQREIRTRLKEFGRITMAIVVKDSKGESKGTAFVKFSTSIRQINKKIICFSKITQNRIYSHGCNYAYNYVI